MMEQFDWTITTGVGLYPVPMVARLLNEKPRIVRSWLEGYSHSEADPIIVRQLPHFGGKTVFGFLDLIEALFIKHFVDLGLSPQAIRKVAERLRVKYKELHPFATNKRFRTDGRRIFLEVVETPEERRILDILTDNFVMAQVIEQSLFDSILYADDLAFRWRPLPDAPQIILDPKIAFGKPVVEGKWIPTGTLYRAFQLNADAEEVADEFGIEPRIVSQAIEFERRMAEAVVN